MGHAVSSAEGCPATPSRQQRHLQLVQKTSPPRVPSTVCVLPPALCYAPGRCRAAPASTAMWPQQQHWAVPRPSRLFEALGFACSVQCPGAKPAPCLQAAPRPQKQRPHSSPLSATTSDHIRGIEGSTSVSSHGSGGQKFKIGVSQGHAWGHLQSRPCHTPPALWWLRACGPWLWPLPSSLYPCFHVASPPIRTLVIRFGAQIIQDDLITSSLT